MEKFETLADLELTTILGGSHGHRSRRRRRRMVANCAGDIGEEAFADGLKGGLAGTALGTPVGTAGGAIFGANIGIIRGSFNCIAGL